MTARATATDKPASSVTRRSQPNHDTCDPIALDPIETAKIAGLRYVTDHEPGIRRHKTGRGFAYRGTDGTKLKVQDNLARIKALAIPPAWTDVWICTRSDGHLQATGRDARGRKQYRYHPHWRAVRDETKYRRLLDFGRALPRIRARVEADLQLPGLPREKVIAAVVQLLQQTQIRIGNQEYVKTNGSHGLTTLLDDHVDIDGRTTRFVFRGKSGKEHKVGLRDRRLANIVRRCRDLPGQTLFQYVDEHGKVCSVGSADVNEYLREISNQGFTAKDFRTWFGTVMALFELSEGGPESSERERTHRIVQAVATVSSKLGNTPAICRKCYVHPLVFDAYLDGRLKAIAARRRIGRHGGVSSYSGEEQLLLRLLESETNGSPST